MYTEPQLTQDHITLGKRTSAGARRWVDVHFYTDIQACFEHIKKDYQLVLGTHLGKKSGSLYEQDLTQSVALLFGNEHNGLSKEVLKYSDGNFLIPQLGFVQNLNISVACAVTVYEAYRQRLLAGLYGPAEGEKLLKQQALLVEYLRRHELGETLYKSKKINPS